MKQERNWEVKSGIMVIGGISKIGSYHEKNQDSFLCKPYKDGVILVVSDGMGSKSLSHYGSKCLCECIYDVINNYSHDIDIISFKDVVFACHEEWKTRLREFELSQCYATMLVAVIRKNNIKAARLGDGFLSICADDHVHILYDKKDSYFANETDCVREVLDREKIEINEFDYHFLSGVIACTDGIEIGTMQEEELVNFTRDFIDEYSNKNSDEVVLEIEQWIKDWPGADDKTLAFVMEGEE